MPGNPVPRLNTPAQRDAQWADLSLPRNDVRPRHANGRNSGKLAQEKPFAVDARYALRRLRGILLVSPQLHEESVSWLSQVRRALPGKCRRTNLQTDPLHGPRDRPPRPPRLVLSSVAAGPTADHRRGRLRVCRNHAVNGSETAPTLGDKVFPIH